MDTGVIRSVAARSVPNPLCFRFASWYNIFLSILNPFRKYTMTNTTRFTGWLATAVISLALLALGACSSNPTTINYDQTADFSQFKTYAFMADLATDKQAYESLESTFLKNSVARELNKTGLEQVQSNPDLLINFSIETEEKIRSRSVPTGGYGVGYDPYYDVYGSGWGSGHTTQIDQYTDGKLVIDAIDVKSKKIVWQGSTHGRLTSKAMKNYEVTLDEAVKEIFAASLETK
jgi:hypothetical protein